MLKESNRNVAAESKLNIPEEEFNLKRKGDAIGHIEKHLKAYNKEPYSMTIYFPNDKIQMFGYKRVATVLSSNFIVHICDKKSESSIEYTFGMDVCKKLGPGGFRESLIDDVFTKNAEKLHDDSKFDAIAVVATAMNKQKIRPKVQVSKMMDTTSVFGSTREFKEQLHAVLKLEKYEEKGIPPKNAVFEVLADISTDQLIQACSEYGLEKQGVIASYWLKREKNVKDQLRSFLDKWENTRNPQLRLGELRDEIKKIGLSVKFYEKLNELKGRIGQKETALHENPTTMQTEIPKLNSLSRKIEELERESRAGLTDSVYKNWGELGKKAKEMELFFEPLKKEELEENAEQAGMDICELSLKRRISRYGGDAYMQMRRSSLEETLMLVKKIGEADESNKP